MAETIPQDRISSTAIIIVGALVALVSGAFMLWKNSFSFILFLVVGIGFIIFGTMQRVKSPKTKSASKHAAGGAAASPMIQQQLNVHHNIQIRECGQCHNKVYSNYRYCPFCGTRQ